MNVTQYERAMELAANARALAEEIARLRDEPDDDTHPHSPVVAGAVKAAIQTSGLEVALRAFEAAMYSSLPDIRGEHDRELHTRRLTAGYVCFHGNLEPESYADLHEAARAAGFDWREYEVGIGAGGLEIVVAFGAHVAAGLIYEFLKGLREKRLSPSVDAEAAIHLCKADLLTRSRSAMIGAAYALSSPLTHSKYEVYLHDAEAECVYMFLVRADGEISGRKERRTIGQARNDVS